MRGRWGSGAWVPSCDMWVSRLGAWCGMSVLGVRGRCVRGERSVGACVGGVGAGCWGFKGDGSLAGDPGQVVFRELDDDVQSELIMGYGEF